MSSKYMVLDLETGVDNIGDEAIGKMKASPFYTKNEVVLSGATSSDPTKCGVHILEGPCRHPPNMGEILVGHNLKFDLLYQMRDDAWEEWLGHPTSIIWCTQLAEYLIRGQVPKFPSLDQCSAKYGGTQKDDLIKGFWDCGVRTQDIPMELLSDYLEDDVLNTECVYLQQYCLADKLGMLPLIQSQMRALKATTAMEWNGMAFDKGLALDFAHKLAPKLERATFNVLDLFHATGMVGANPQSSAHVATYLFGGDYSHLVKEEMLDADGFVIRYKSGPREGEIRYKNVLREVTVPAHSTGTPAFTPSGRYKTDDDTLSKLPSNPLIDSVIKIRGIQKDISTYYQGYSELAWPDHTLPARVGVIHPSFNHCNTNTGRLSSSSPNLQNAAT